MQIFTEHTEREYKHATSELARYETESLKLVSYISLLGTTTFLVGVGNGVEAVFPVIPLFSFVLAHFLLSVHYAYRVRERYVHYLEEIILSPSDHPIGLYRYYIADNYLNIKGVDRLLTPFNALIIQVAVLMAAMSLYSAWRAYAMFEQLPYRHLADAYVLGLCALLTYYAACVYRFFSGPKTPLFTPQETDVVNTNS